MFDELNTDIYVFPRSFEWSMAFTHEASLGLGPYFAWPSDATTPEAVS